jgi:hypothetical protein
MLYFLLLSGPNTLKIPEAKKMLKTPDENIKIKISRRKAG